jgi:hypothetical protein
MSNSTDSLVNGTLVTIITDLAERELLIGIGGAALGVGSLSLLILLVKYISKKFAPGPDGKRPSISNVASSIFSLAKKKAASVVEDLEKDLEKEVKAAIKNPKKILTAVQDHTSTLKSVVSKDLTKAVKNNLPVSESSVILKVIDEVIPSTETAIPNQVPATTDQSSL